MSPGYIKLEAQNKNAEGRVMGKRFFLTLVIGISAGCSFAYIILTSTGFSEDTASHTSDYRDSVGNLEEYPIIGISEHSPDEAAHKDDNRTIADELFKKVRVLCWVMTQPDFHELRAKIVKKTWGKRCNKLLFMSSKEDPTLPTINLPGNEGRGFLWGKTKAAFRYVYEHHRKDADWFMKADDDTYVVVENLRYMLADYNPKDPLYFGFRFKHSTSQGYMSGGAGYVLSGEALDQFVNKALPSPTLCRQDGQGAEDAEMGKCLDKIGVLAMDSRDVLKRGRFFPFVPQNHMFPYFHKDYWYWKAIYYPTDEGLDCCSDYAITFHYIKPQLMLLMDYLIYHLHPYGIKHGSGRLPKLLSGSNDTELQDSSNSTELLGDRKSIELPDSSNATNMQGGSNATEMQGGSNATEMQGGSNATEMQGVSNATEMQGGSNATEMQDGSKAINIQGDSKAIKMQGGSNATEMQGGSNATEMQDGSNATKIQGGSDAIKMQGGSNATMQIKQR